MIKYFVYFAVGWQDYLSSEDFGGWRDGLTYIWDKKSAAQKYVDLTLFLVALDFFVVTNVS